MKKITHKKQENISALFAVAGDVMTMGVADAPAIAASCLYLSANAIMYKYGHTSWGLAAAWSLYSVGNAVLSTSKILEGNPTLHAAFVTYCALWAVGALRYPLGRAGMALRHPEKIKESMITAGESLVRIAAKSKSFVKAAGMVNDRIIHEGEWVQRKTSSAETKESMITAGESLVRIAAKSKPYIGATAVALDVGLVLSTLFGNPNKVNVALVGASLCWITADFLAGRVQKLLRKPISCVKNAFAPS